MSKPPKRPHSKAAVKKIVNSPGVKRMVAQARLQAQADAQTRATRAKKRPPQSAAARNKAVAKVKKAQERSRTQTAARRFVNSGRRGKR